MILSFVTEGGVENGFQHLPRDLANINEWKIMFDPYIMACFYDPKHWSKNSRFCNDKGWIKNYQFVSKMLFYGIRNNFNVTLYAVFLTDT